MKEMKGANVLNIWLAKSPKAALNIIQKKDKSNWVAIETEYGDISIGAEQPKVALALNHHGDLQSNEPPALVYRKISGVRFDNFIISHIDLDVLFCILWTSGWLKKTFVTEQLSELVAFADTEGFHKVKDFIKKNTIPNNIVNKYFAIGYLVNSWVINDNGLEEKDISKEVHKLLLRIKDIILNEVTEDQIKTFENWFEQQKKIARAHVKEIIELCNEERLFVFRAPFSLITAYDLGETKAVIIIQYNEQSKSISLGCYDEEIAKKYFGKKGVVEPLQKFFNSEAGGKITVGGTPRNIDIQPEMVQAFIEFLNREYFNIPEIIQIEEKV